MKKKILIGFLLLTIVCGAAYGTLKYLAKKRAVEEIDRYVSRAEAVEGIDYESLDVGLLGPKFSLNKVSLRLKGLDDAITMDRVIIRDLKQNGNLLVFLDLKIDEIRIFSPDLVRLLSRHGNGASTIPVFFLSAKYRYDPVSKTLNLNSLNLKSKDVGQLNIDLELTNIDMNNIFIENPVASIPAMFGVYIHKAGIEYDDYSMIKNIMESETDPENEPIKKARIRAIRTIEMEIQKEKSPDVRKVLSSANAFLKNPDRIQIRISPKEPVPLGRLLWVRSLGELIRLLDIRIDT